MENLERKNIRLVIMGDQGVGKSSLIYAMISQLPIRLQKTLRRVVLPPDMCIYSKQIFTELIDTPADIELNQSQELKFADLVLLVYDVSSQESIDRLSSYWLPQLTQFMQDLPIIIIGNKLDVIELAIQQQENHTHVRDILKSLTQQFTQVQMGIECSAYYDRNVKAVLNCAQRAVLYPLSPLYNMRTREITPKFKRALIRIFRILDKDMDGKLSDQQLATLQQRVFKNQLNADDIRVIKDMIHRQLEQINEDHITFDGFLTLHKKCIQMLKIQISWSILRYFRYTNSLDLKVPQQKFVMEHGQSLQLTSQTIDFLTSIFNKASRISDDPMQFVFRCSPSTYRPLQQFWNTKISLQNFCWDGATSALQTMLNGYQHEIGETFRKTSSKTTFKQMSKMKLRKILSVCLVQNRNYGRYQNGLFQGGKEEPQQHFTRKWKLFGKQNTSKIILLFKVDSRHLRQFLNSKIGKKVDLVLYFEGRQQQAMSDITANQIRQMMTNQTTLVRMISKDVAQQKLHVFNLSMDLQAVPVRFKQSSFDEFFDFVLSTFSHIESGLSKKTIESLKVKQKGKTYMVIGGFGLALAIGLFAFKRLRV